MLCNVQTHLAASASLSKTPSSLLMLLMRMAALHLAPALVTPLYCEVLVRFLFLICNRLIHTM